MPLPKKLRNKILEFLIKNPSIEEIMKKVEELAYSNEAKPRTILTRYSQFKNLFRDMGFKDDVITNIKPKRELVDNVIEDNKRIRAVRDNFLITRPLISKLNGLRNSNNAIEQLIYLQYVSRLRINEVINPEFEVFRVKKKTNKVRFSHLSKQRNNPHSAHVVILPLLKAGEFITMLNKFRSFNIYSINTMNKKVNRYLKKLKKKLTSHNIRGIGVLQLWRIWNLKKQNLNGFIQTHLNHDSYDASMHYSFYTFSNEFN